MDAFEDAKAFFYEGLDHLKKEEWSKAEVCLKESLRLVPNRPSTLNNLAAALLKLKKFDEAKAVVEKASIADPNATECWLNEGILLAELKRHEDALVSFDRVIRLKADNAEVYSNRGVTLNELMRFDEALASFDQAIRLNSGDAEVYCNRGATLYELKRFDEALVSYDRAIKLKADFAAAWFNKGSALHELKRYDEAIICFEAAIDNKFKNADLVEFMLASLKAQSATPKSPPKEFFTKLFDSFADDFENHLVRNLKYGSHITLYNILKTFIQTNLNILDMGCGTGLTGGLLKPHAEFLTGIDISGKMLEQADNKNIYTDLHKADLNKFLIECENNLYDLIVATDVFIYTGDLSETFSSCHRVLKNGGYLGFTVEKLDAGDFSLNKTLRYSHSAEYCQSLGKANGFDIRHFETNMIRQESGTDVVGYYFVLQKI